MKKPKPDKEMAEAVKIACPQIGGMTTQTRKRIHDELLLYPSRVDALIKTLIVLPEFLNMLGNYDQRKVDRFTKGELVIDTAAVSDGKQPYETAIQDPHYNNGDWIVVEAYGTRDLAQRGHNRWVKKMTKNPPAQLKDCLNCPMAELSSYATEIFKRKKPCTPSN